LKFYFKNEQGNHPKAPTLSVRHAYSIIVIGMTAAIIHASQADSISAATAMFPERA
jgi:hypothetical protein